MTNINDVAMLLAKVQHGIDKRIAIEIISDHSLTYTMFRYDSKVVLVIEVNDDNTIDLSCGWQKIKFEDFTTFNNRFFNVDWFRLFACDLIKVEGYE